MNLLQKMVVKINLVIEIIGILMVCQHHSYMKLVGGSIKSIFYRGDFLTCFFPLDAPKVTMPTRTPGYYLQPGKILCSVESLLPFTLSFMRNGIALGVDQYLRCVNVPLSCSIEP